MSRFVALTLVSEEGNTLYANVDAISHYRQVGKLTRVTFRVSVGEKLHALSVQETPGEIAVLIEQTATVSSQPSTRRRA